MPTNLLLQRVYERPVDLPLTVHRHVERVVRVSQESTRGRGAGGRGQPALYMGGVK